MPYRLTSDCSKEALAKLASVVVERTAAEQELLSTYETDLAAVEQHYQEASKQLATQYEQEKTATQAEFKQLKEKTEAEFQSDRDSTQAEYNGILRDVERRVESDLAAAEARRKEVMEEGATLFDAADRRMNNELDGLKKQRLKVQQQIATAVAKIDEIVAAGIDELHRRRLWREFPDAETPPATEKLPAVARLTSLVDEAKELLVEVQGQFVAQSFSGLRPLWVFLMCWAAAVLPTISVLRFPMTDLRWIVLSAGGGVALTALVLGAIYPFASKQTLRAGSTFRRIQHEAEELQRDAVQSLEAEFRQRTEECQAKYSETLAARNREKEKAEAAHRELIGEAYERRDGDLNDANSKYPMLLEEINVRFERRMEELNATYPPRLAELDARFERDKRQLDEQYERRKTEINERRESQWQDMAHAWRYGLAQFREEVSAINDECDAQFRPWSAIATDGWSPTVNMPTALPVGRYRINLADIKGGVPDDKRLKPLSTTYAMPVLLAFPEHISMMIKSTGLGRIRAEEFMQSVMLRLLVSLPAGRCRFTIIDPIGLGENFSGFMHLTDFDELLVTSRIWTESQHIERRLTDLTEHMENVFQKYLRNEFRSIQEYNETAGEVAEPYHFLIVANFPVNFSESAARRLVSIVSSGPRCGVFTLLSVDEKQHIPHNFKMEDIEQHVTTLRATGSNLVCDHPYLDEIVVEPFDPPTPEQLRTIVRSVGEESKGARRVEVAFDRIAPEAGRLWSSDSRKGIDVPLGRAGATKLLHLALGKGTSQHVLIAGKTGSGKSTLLHVMITNAALHYSPQEIEFYLVDFKKGVEFKTYATQTLPHARVIAIESDREFGLSVLQRLDAVMHERGDLFREHGVQDVAGFRDKRPDAVMPRILLLIDEFQEFFVEDDRVAQMSTLLLDRLVRQGRAFGIHVVLGSQTLSGAYTLARSTLGQVAVRIALECSDADAHVILSEENTAARRLSRPGEAIYNDANGLLEGNNPFQVSWLPDDERETYLKRLHQKARDEALQPPPPIVFEGNVPADLAENTALAALIESGNGEASGAAAKAWLGAAVAIKAPVCVEFHRQTAANLLVVGRDFVAVTGVLSATLISLAAHHRAGNGSPDGPRRFYILDGSAADTSEGSHWKDLAGSIPHEVELAGPRDADAAIAAVAAELARRQQEDDILAAPIYLFVVNLSRFRNLRRAEDDFSFGGMDDDKAPKPDKQFAEILREGPALGIHAVIWCDTYTNLERYLPRRALHDFEMRAIFQMSSTDSSQLIDSPIAAKLGPHRGLLYLEEQGGVEKFRPYNPPSAEWLVDVKERLQRAVDSCSS